MCPRARVAKGPGSPSPDPRHLGGANPVILRRSAHAPPARSPRLRGQGARERAGCFWHAEATVRHPGSRVVVSGPPEPDAATLYLARCSGQRPEKACVFLPPAGSGRRRGRRLSRDPKGAERAPPHCRGGVAEVCACARAAGSPARSLAVLRAGGCGAWGLSACGDG